MYRKDVFQKYNVKVPTTLDELEAAAKALNGKAMTDDGQPGFGFVARGKRAAATSIFSGYLHAMGGDLDDSEPRAGVQLRGRQSRPSSCTGACSSSTDLPAPRTITGTRPRPSWDRARRPCTRSSIPISAFVEDPEKSKVKGKMGYVMFPKGPGGKPGDDGHRLGSRHPQE